MKNVCVFCSSSNNLNEAYLNDAKKLGELIGQGGYNLVYGGSFRGLMGCVAEGAKKCGARVIGVMPHKIYHLIEQEKGPVDDFILTDTLRQRKEVLDKNSDVIIALAGGFGTLDEIIEMIDLKLLSYHKKPVIFLNTNGFYDKLFEFFKKITDENFANKSALNAIYLANTPEDIMNYIKNYKISEENLITFKI